MSFSQIQSVRVPSRSELIDMVAAFTAKGGGEVREFKRGFTSDWSYLQDLLKGFGYEVKAVRASSYIVRKIGEKGRPRLLGRTEAIRTIDKVLVANGLQPFMATRQEFSEARP